MNVRAIAVLFIFAQLCVCFDAADIGVASSPYPIYKRLNISEAAVLLVDYQTGLISLVQDFEPNEFQNNVLALATLAKYFKLPTVITTSRSTGPNGPILPEIPALFPNVSIVARPGQINAWDDPDFKAAVEATGRKQLIVGGVVTDVCVTFLALSLIEEGYDVYAVTDASGTFTKEIRDASHIRMAAAGVQLVNFFAVACELARDWRTDLTGLADYFSEFIPGYKNIITSYDAFTTAK